MTDSGNEPIDPLTALERLLITAGPTGIAAATDACRKLVRIYAQRSRLAESSPGQASETFREIISRSIPTLEANAREGLVESLDHTFQVWARK